MGHHQKERVERQRFALTRSGQGTLVPTDDLANRPPTQFREPDPLDVAAEFAPCLLKEGFAGRLQYARGEALHGRFVAIGLVRVREPDAVKMVFTTLSAASSASVRAASELAPVISFPQARNGVFMGFGHG